MRAHAATSRRLSADLLAQHGLTLNDYEALHLLSVADGQRMKRIDLANALHLTPSGVTRLLEGLEEGGLVAKDACPTDLRVTYAALTDAGREKLEAASCGHVGSVRALFEEYFSEEQLESLASLLEQLPGACRQGAEPC